MSISALARTIFSAVVLLTCTGCIATQPATEPALPSLAEAQEALAQRHNAVTIELVNGEKVRRAGNVVLTPDTVMYETTLQQETASVPLYRVQRIVGTKLDGWDEGARVGAVAGLGFAALTVFSASEWLTANDAGLVLVFGALVTGAGALAGTIGGAVLTPQRNVVYYERGETVVDLPIEEKDGP